MRYRQPGDVCWRNDPFKPDEPVLVVLKKIKKKNSGFSGWYVENLRTKEKTFVYGTYLSAALNEMAVLAWMASE